MSVILKEKSKPAEARFYFLHCQTSLLTNWFDGQKRKDFGNLYEAFSI